jgi:hypothetical protein
MTGVLDDAQRLIRERPALVVGGLVAVFIGAQLIGGRAGISLGATGSDGVTDEGIPEPPDESGAALGSGPALELPSAVAPYAYNPWMAPTTPPLDYGGYQDPADPSTLTDVDYCGPKPKLPTGKTDADGAWKCDRSARQWKWVPKVNNPPDPPGPTVPAGAKIEVTVPAGKIALYTMVNGKITGRAEVTIDKRRVWYAGEIVPKQYRPNGAGKPPVWSLRLAKLLSGPHKGRWVNTAAKGIAQKAVTS